MKIEEIHNNFIKRFNEEFKDFKIISFTNKSSEIIVEDSEGIRYSKKTCAKIFQTKFTIESIIDKFSYIKNKINKIHPNIKIIEFKDMKTPLILEDENGVRYKKKYQNILTSNFNILNVIDKELYIQNKINEKFTNLKLIEYNGTRGKLLVEDEFGFKYRPNCYDLTHGSKVSILTCTEKEKLFIFKSNIKHNNFYIYNDFVYKNGKTKITITCPIHGDFKQIGESHLQGHGCPKCNIFGFNKESWLKKNKNNKTFFYVLRIFNESEEFIKIGITSRTINKRYKNLKNYKLEIIKIIEDSPSKTFDMEKKILKENKMFKYLPKLPFEGWTECLSIECLNKFI